MAVVVELKLVDTSHQLSLQQQSEIVGDVSEDSSMSYKLQYPNETDIPSVYIRSAVEMTGGGLDVVNGNDNNDISKNSHGCKEVIVCIPQRYAVCLTDYLDKSQAVVLVKPDNLGQSDLTKSTGFISNKDKVKKLCLTLDFAIYLQDVDYTNLIIDQLIGYWLSAKDIICRELNSLALDEVMLRLPYDLIPKTYTDNKKFRSLWVASNDRDQQRTVSLTVTNDDELTYHFNVPHEIRVTNLEGTRTVKLLSSYYTKNGKKHSVQTRLYDVPDFPLHSTTNCVNNGIHGLQYNYSQQGYIRSVTTYFSNRIEGPTFRFNEAGVVIRIGIDYERDGAGGDFEVFTGEVDDNQLKFSSSQVRTNQLISNSKSELEPVSKSGSKSKPEYDLSFKLSDTFEALNYPNTNNRWSYYQSIIDSVRKHNMDLLISL